MLNRGDRTKSRRHSEAKVCLQGSGMYQCPIRENSWKIFIYFDSVASRFISNPDVEVPSVAITVNFQNIQQLVIPLTLLKNEEH
jgi:hypothetical protein